MKINLAEWQFSKRNIWKGRKNEIKTAELIWKEQKKLRFLERSKNQRKAGGSERPGRTSDMLLFFTYDSTLLLRSSFSPSISTALRLSSSSRQTTGRPYSSRSTPPPDTQFPPMVDWLPLKTGRSCSRWEGGTFRLTQLIRQIFTFLKSF